MKVVCHSVTLVELKKHDHYKLIKGRSTMNKAELCKAINKIIGKTETKPPSKAVTKAKSPIKSTPKSKSPSVLSASQTLPLEIYRKIMLDMNPSDMMNACSTHKQALKLCLDDNFWKDYYNNHRMKFIPRPPYDFKERIITARVNIMAVMDIYDLEKECQKDKQSKKICQSQNFWEIYHHSQGYDKNALRNKSDISTKIEEYKLLKLKFKDPKKIWWLSGKILPQNREAFMSLLSQYPHENRYKYFAFRDSKTAEITVKATNTNAYLTMFRIVFKTGNQKLELDTARNDMITIFKWMKK